MAKILVVEDDADFGALALKVLSKRGHDVTVIATGRGGIEHALGSQTDLVLMDLRLPEIDGCDAAREIKAAKPGLPVVACSANVMQADVDRAEAAGCDGFLGKPYQVSDLLSTVARFVP